MKDKSPTPAQVQGGNGPEPSESAEPKRRRLSPAYTQSPLPEDNGLGERTPPGVDVNMDDDQEPAKASTASDAEQIDEEQEEISGYIDLAQLDRTLASNMLKLCSVYYPQ